MKVGFQSLISSLVTGPWRSFSGYVDRDVLQSKLLFPVQNKNFAKKAWFRLKCLGTKIDSSNMVTYEARVCPVAQIFKGSKNHIISMLQAARQAGETAITCGR